jgi:hypothetical protein
MAVPGLDPGIDPVIHAAVAAECVRLPRARTPACYRPLQRAHRDSVPPRRVDGRDKPGPDESERLAMRPMLSNLLPADKRHCDRISIFAVDINGIAYNSFPHETDPLVKRDRPRVVGMHVQFDANKTGAERRFQGRIDKSCPEAAASIGSNNPHAEGPAMSVRGKEMPSDVAPPDDFAFR